MNKSKTTNITVKYNHPKKSKNFSKNPLFLLVLLTNLTSFLLYPAIILLDLKNKFEFSLSKKFRT